jgi:hypothetical protein
MSQALQRFRDLQRKFRAAIPGRKMTFQQHRMIAAAASLQQISEQTLAAQIASGWHDRGLIERLQSEARDIITAASARPHQEKKRC